jgi:hypothetical protein
MSRYLEAEAPQIPPTQPNLHAPQQERGSAVASYVRRAGETPSRLPSYQTGVKSTSPPIIRNYLKACEKGAPLLGAPEASSVHYRKMATNAE